MARILVTSALPYINGIKHLGNLIGSQLPADLFARYCRARGDEVLFLCATDEHGTPAELAVSLRWIGIMAQKVDCDLAASTGVHDGAALVKQLLAGAKAVQTASSLYQKGPAHIETMLGDLKSWMQRHEFQSLADFRGRMSQEKASNPAIYERTQFMRYFGSEKDVT